MGRTKLDRERNRMCLREMERISHEAALVRKVRKSNLDDKLAVAKELYQTLLKLYEGKVSICYKLYIIL